MGSLVSHALIFYCISILVEKYRLDVKVIISGKKKFVV
jgi:hypothetical protein